MKDNKIDDLFRQKLGHQKLTPPPSAWAAVEQNLPGEKKRGIYFWISVAASLLLICTLGWLVLTGENTSTTPDKTVASTEKQPSLIENPAPAKESLVAGKETDTEKPGILKDGIKEPSYTQLKASVDKKNQNSSNTGNKAAETGTSIVAANESEATDRREVVSISLIKLEDHLSINSLAGELEFDMIMPITLTDYYIPYSEDLRPIPKKKKFRVLNGIISIAKEVNSSKLSLSELRNAKNNFVTDDLKYGTKTDEGVDDDPQDEPNKD